jgi:hypothetical protein
VPSFACRGPESPNPSAIIAIEVEPFPPTSFMVGSTCCWNTSVLLIERGGVGVTIAVVDVQWIESDAVVASAINKISKRIVSLGTLIVSILSQHQDRCHPDILRIIVSGRDDNGHTVRCSKNFSLPATGF